jgi:hypothetical protein
MAATGEQGMVGGFGLGLVLAMEVPNLFSAPLPSKFTIATFAGGDGSKTAHTYRWIRSGEIEGVLQAILLGVGGSMLTRSPWPFALVMLMTGWKVWSYEDALRRGVKDGPGLDMAAGAAP